MELQIETVRFPDLVEDLFVTVAPWPSSTASS
jgi:hypothetical protein